MAFFVTCWMSVFVYLCVIPLFCQTAEEKVTHVHPAPVIYEGWEVCFFSIRQYHFWKIKMDPDEVKVMLNAHEQKTAPTLPGFANFYRPFIQKYSEVAAPLHPLNSSNTTFSWSPEAEAAFHTLLSKISSSLVLWIPAPQLQFGKPPSSHRNFQLPCANMMWSQWSASPGRLSQVGAQVRGAFPKCQSHHPFCWVPPHSMKYFPDQTRQDLWNLSLYLVYLLHSLSLASTFVYLVMCVGWSCESCSELLNAYFYHSHSLTVPVSLCEVCVKVRAKRYWMLIQWS